MTVSEVIKKKMCIRDRAYGEEDRSEFYSFVRSLDALKTSMKGEDKTVILSADSPIAQIFDCLLYTSRCV